MAGIAAPIWLDVSRLLSRARFGAPTGIDRVEHAYAEHLLALVPERLSFVALDPVGHLRRLPPAPAARFIAALGEHWAAGNSSAGRVAVLARGLWLQAMLPGNSGRAAGRPFYVLVSHRHLHRRARIEAVLAAADARLAVFIHDLIPIQYPEYVRAPQPELHLQRVRTTAALGAAVIVNSHVTAAALRPYLAAVPHPPRLLVAPLGLEARWAQAAVPVPAHPYFVLLSTIEPRKNHLLMLQVWRRLAAEMGAAAPRLVIVGRRGWEIESVIHFLERSPGISGLVSEHGAASDAAIGALLKGARALLFPSFAEGFGLPVAEALACGVPVICSDLPELRETGGGAPDYVDPIDGLGWMAAVRAYVPEGSARRAAQVARIAAWRRPTWAEHFAAVLGLLDGL